MPTARILVLGDSISRGADDNPSGFRTYRGTLQNLLSTAGFDYNLVGPEYAPPASGGNDPDVAAWGGAGIDSVTSASNNLTDRLPTLNTQFPNLELLIILIGWNDCYNSPAGTIASRYATFLNAVQSGAWANVKAVICTLHPQPGQTEAQTNSSVPAYQNLNTQIRSMAASNRIVADLASRSSIDAAAWLEGMIYDAQNAPEFSTIAGGASIPAALGGHNVTSFKSMQDFNANWSTNPPYPGVGPGGASLVGPASQGPGNPRFINSVAAIVPWFWVWALAGDSASNTCIEARNGFAGAKRGNGQWGFFFEGSRFGAGGNGYTQWWDRDGARNPFAANGQRADGITSWYKPSGNTGMEIWPEDTVPSRGVQSFFGGFNRELMSNAVVYMAGCQVRLSLINPNGANDIASARLGAAIGMDFYSNLGGYHYDWLGFPYNVQDGGHDRWKRITSTEWVWVTCISIGSGSGGHWMDPGMPPPLSNYGYAHPYNNIPTYSLSAADLRAAPPPLPQYVSGGGSGYLNADYWTNTNTGVKDIHMTQSGADKLADAIAGVIRSSGVLNGFVIGSGGGGQCWPLTTIAPLRASVRYIRDTGNNANDGLTTATAWRTYENATLHPVPVNTDIVFPDATYNSPAGKEIFASYGALPTIANGVRFISTALGGTQVIGAGTAFINAFDVWKAVDGFDIVGMRFSNWKASGVITFAGEKQDNVRILRNHFSGNGNTNIGNDHDIYISSSASAGDTWLIEGNTADETGNIGAFVHIYSGDTTKVFPKNLTIRYNAVKFTGVWGIILDSNWPADANLRIQNNDIRLTNLGTSSLGDLGAVLDLWQGDGGSFGNLQSDSVIEGNNFILLSGGTTTTFPVRRQAVTPTNANPTFRDNNLYRVSGTTLVGGTQGLAGWTNYSAGTNTAPASTATPFCSDGGGGSSAAVLPGLPTAPNYVDKLTASLKTWGLKNWSTGGGVDVPPAWQTSALIPARHGVAYSETVLANGVPTPTYSVTSTLPGWLSFNAGTRTLSGTPPSNEQSVNISFLATNVAGSAALNVTLAINDAVQILTTSLPNAIQNAAYSQVVEAAGVEPFTWSVDSGSLPAGLELTSGLISGTPTAASGTSSFVLRVSDVTGQSDTQSLSITNGIAGNVPVIAPASLPSGLVGAAYSQALSATGAATITWLKVSGSIPPGITVNPTTGAITGTPTVAGSFGFTVRATNPFGFGEQTFSLLITASAVAGIASPWSKFTGSRQ